MLLCSDELFVVQKGKGGGSSNFLVLPAASRTPANRALIRCRLPSQKVLGMPSRKFVWDPEHWRFRAEEARTVADQMTHEESRTISGALPWTTTVSLSLPRCNSFRKRLIEKLRTVCSLRAARIAAASDCEQSRDAQEHSFRRSSGH